MTSVNCEGNPILAWPSTCLITNSTGAERFTITDTKLYALVVTLSTQDNAKLLQQLTSGFKRTINWNNVQIDVKNLFYQLINNNIKTHGNIRKIATGQ